MKKRNPLAVVLLSVITFGIYDLYWLVKTKKVLNDKTKFHTPTIWLLILPYTLLIIGYILLFTTGTLTSNSNTAYGSSEQINTQGSPRPSQYVHICNSSGGGQYVTQGSPNCLGNDSYQGDYGSSVPGTLYSSPCKTTSGTFRYVYIAQSESCPSGTSLEFYNNLCPANATTSSECTNSSNGSTSSVKHPGILFLSLGLIFLGFITTFSLSVFWFYRFSKAINEYTRGKMSTAVTFLILWLIHLVGVALIQDTFNDLEEEPVGATTSPPQHSPLNSIYPSATSGIGGPSTPPPSMPTSPINPHTNNGPPVQNTPAPILPIPPVDLDEPQDKDIPHQDN